MNRKKNQNLKTKELNPSSRLAMSVPSRAFRPFARIPQFNKDKEFESENDLQKFRSFWTFRLDDEEEMESKNKCGQFNIEELVAEELEKRGFGIQQSQKLQ